MIIPFFGKWPEWIDLYLYSCSKNSFIDFLFYTDCKIPKKVYANTIFIEVSFSVYCERVSNILNIDFHPNAPYKLCDLKPFYGVIHENELRNYDWWGFGDMDLVYGDLKSFINEKNMKCHDLLTTHVDRVAGHFTIIRKSSKYNNICLQLHNWQAMLQSDKNYGIDENSFSKVVRPIKFKLFDKIWYHVLCHVVGDKCKHQAYSLWERMSSIVPSSVCMRELFTTFKPTQDTLCTYNLATHALEVKTNMLKYVSWGVKCTCIFSSSRRLNIGIQICIGVKDSIRYLKAMTSQRAA